VAHFNSGISHWESAVGSTGTKLTPGNSTSGTVRSDYLSSFSPFTFGFIGSVALPVQLITFNAKKLSGNTAQLTWTITDNSTPDNFEVLKSSDGRNFNGFGTVPSIAGKYSYDLLDNSLTNGTTYYRLKLIEKDGSVAFSKVVAVLNGIKGVLITSMMPTIVKDRSRLNISSSDNGNMKLTVTDIHGRIVKQQAAGIVPGNQEVWLELQMLSRGTYFVTGYFNGQRTSAIGFIKQ
jgi:hypothetical protein